MTALTALNTRGRLTTRLGQKKATPLPYYPLLHLSFKLLVLHPVKALSRTPLLMLITLPMFLQVMPTKVFLCLMFITPPTSEVALVGLHRCTIEGPNPRSSLWEVPKVESTLRNRKLWKWWLLGRLQT